jgi:hypothetical protein
MNKLPGDARAILADPDTRRALETAMSLEIQRLERCVLDLSLDGSSSGATRLTFLHQQLEGARKLRAGVLQQINPSPGKR